MTDKEKREPKDQIIVNVYEEEDEQNSIDIEMSDELKSIDALSIVLSLLAYITGLLKIDLQSKKGEEFSEEEFEEDIMKMAKMALNIN